MTPEFAIQILRQALLTALWLSAPLLLVGFVVGILVSLVQILTSIQDTAFAAIPRLLAFLAAFILAMPWMLQKMTAYTVTILETSAAMGGDITVSTATLLGFLLTLVRISGVFVFVPLPGIVSTLHPARIVLAGGITIALFPLWPQVSAGPSVGQFVIWIASEAALGIGIGLALAFVIESFAVAAQVMGLQAGFAYASTIDPNTQADSSVLVIFVQLAVGLLFFAMGLDRELVRIFAGSLAAYPAGSYELSRGVAEQVIALGSMMFSTGLRLALPMVAVLVMVDMALALLGRVNAQLQLITIAFPVKILVSLVLLGYLVSLFPTLFRSGCATAFTVARRLAAH